MFIAMAFEVKQDGDSHHVKPVRLEYSCRQDEEAFAASLLDGLLVGYGAVGGEAVLVAVEETPPFATRLRRWPLAPTVRVSATGQG